MGRRNILLSLLAWIVPAALAAHPIDETKVMTSSRFVVGGKTVDFEVKFPAENYARVAPGAASDAAKTLRALDSEEGKRRLSEYVRAHLLAFDGKANLPATVTKIEIERNALSVDNLPREVLAWGRFEGTMTIRDLYLFNEFFKEGPLPHFGDAVVEREAERYDFQFKEAVYFHLDLTAPRRPKE